MGNGTEQVGSLGERFTKLIVFEASVSHVGSAAAQRKNHGVKKETVQKQKSMFVQTKNE